MHCRHGLQAEASNREGEDEHVCEQSSEAPAPTDLHDNLQQRQDQRRRRGLPFQQALAGLQHGIGVSRERDGVHPWQRNTRRESRFVLGGGKERKGAQRKRQKAPGCRH